MADWKIRRRHGECSRCLAAFEDGQRLASLLRVDEEELLVREDLCEACWKEGDSSGYLFWWFTHHHAARARTVQLDLPSIERLFLELEGREEHSLRELRYLLCLLLMRKKRVKLVRVLRGKEGERLVLRRPRRQEELVVHVFEFSPEKLDELRARLQEVLDGAGPLEEEDGSGPDAGAEDERDAGAEVVAAEGAWPEQEGEELGDGVPVPEAGAGEGTSAAPVEGPRAEDGTRSAEADAVADEEAHAAT
jgi:hypothetical protein